MPITATHRLAERLGGEGRWGRGEMRLLTNRVIYATYNEEPPASPNANRKARRPMSENLRRQRTWLETAIVFCIWGTDGLERGKSVPQVSLNTVLLIMSIICVLLAQFGIDQAEEAKSKHWRAETRRYFDRHATGVQVEEPQLDPHLRRTSSIVSACNLVAICAAIYFYRRKVRYAFWIGAGIAGFGTVAAVVLDQLLRQFMT